MDKYINYYACPCGCQWQDESEAMNDDRCPECNTACTPLRSEELE